MLFTYVSLKCPMKMHYPDNSGPNCRPVIPDVEEDRCRLVISLTGLSDSAVM